MDSRIRILTRVAVFAALVFVFSYSSAFLYNVNPAFFIVFSASILWGFWPGVGVGVIGIFLWSNLGPMGPAPFPLLVSQLFGIALTPILGVKARTLLAGCKFGAREILVLALSGILSGLLYHLVVDPVDALLYQPFWPRLIGGLVFSLITIVSNCIIFPLLYPALRFLLRKEIGITA